MGGTSTLDPPAAGIPPIDPRIRARRIQVRRREGRRRLQRLVDAGLVAGVAAAFLGALWTPLLDVEAVQVSGAGRTAPAAVREAAGIDVGDRLVAVDLREAGERIAALPWVHEVRLARGVAGVVTIEVRERTPVAALGTGPQAVLVDRDGRALAAVAAVPDLGPVVTLQGAGAPPPLGSYLDGGAADALVLAERLTREAPGAVSSLQVEELTATLAQGGAVRFGTTTQLDAKLRSLRTVLDQVDLRCLAVIDLRLPGSPVLTREEGCS